LPGLDEDDNNEKQVEKIPDAERNPAKQKPLNFGENGVKAVGIILFNKIGIER
jgi:hypothetical protein